MQPKQIKKYMYSVCNIPCVWLSADTGVTIRSDRENIGQTAANNIIFRPNANVGLTTVSLRD